MNKLIISNAKIENKSYDGLTLEYIESYIPKIKITIFKNIEIEIKIENTIETKLELQIEVKENIDSTIYFIKTGEKLKILLKYFLYQNSHLKIHEFDDLNGIKQQEIIDLNESNASVEYVLKTVAMMNQKYDLVINHKSSKTFSMIYNHGVSESGNITFNVSTYIPKGNTGCIANQNNRIINLNNKECIIRPNLLIEEYDIIANHSAHVGNFTEEEIFYMQRLGIPYDEVIKLLIQGFMKRNTKEEYVTTIFKKYWR